MPPVCLLMGCVGGDQPPPQTNGLVHNPFSGPPITTGLVLLYSTYLTPNPPSTQCPKNRLAGEDFIGSPSFFSAPYDSPIIFWSHIGISQKRTTENAWRKCRLATYRRKHLFAEGARGRGAWEGEIPAFHAFLTKDKFSTTTLPLPFLALHFLWSFSGVCSTSFLNTN